MILFFSYSLNQGRTWHYMNYDRYTANVTMSGLVTEPHSRSRMFSLWGHHSQVESEKTGWVTFTISFKDLLNKKCKVNFSACYFFFSKMQIFEFIAKNFDRF